MKTTRSFGLTIRRGVALALFCAVALAPAVAQIPQRTLSPKELRDDLRILRQTFEKAHGGLYRYTSKEQMDFAFNRVMGRLNKPMTELEFLRTVAPLIDLVHDAHTSIRPSAALRQTYAKSARVFPLHIRYVRGRAFIERNLSTNKAIPAGAEVVAINGRPMEMITEKVLTIKSADGFNRTPKYEVANVNFWINYLEMVDDSGFFRIETRDPKTRAERKYQVAGVAPEVVQGNRFQLQPRENFSLEFVRQDQVALMRIPHFGDLALVETFADAFKKIEEKSVRTLIIDLRENGGGYDELNTELLSYLVARPFRFYRGFSFRATEWADLKYVVHSPDDFLNAPDRKRLSKEDRAKFLEGKTLAQVLDYNCRTNPAAGVHHPKPANRFNGDLFILFNGRSNSSAGEIPALMHFLGVGTLIGEEPNASYQGVTAGIILTLTLPHSGVRVNVPLIAYENAVLPGLFVGRGVPPHFVVPQSLDDAISGRDTALEFTLQMIGARQFQQ